MNKRQRRFLTIIIFLASLGLVFTQVVWIYGVFLNKQEFLEIKIKEVLISVTNSVQEQETFNLLFEGADSASREKLLAYKNVYLSREANIPNMPDDSARLNFIDRSPDGIKRYLAQPSYEAVEVEYIPIEQRVSLAQIDTFLLKELKKINIESEYRIAVCNNSGEKILVSNKYDDIPQWVKIHNRQLFPRDLKGAETYYLSIYFPEEVWAILSEIWPMVISAIALVLVILTIFIYTMYVIVKQKRISEIKGDFISNITHELKTPISTISLAAQLLGDNNIPQYSKNIPKLSGMIKDQSKHLSYLVEKVLQTSVFERQTIVLKEAEVSLHAVIKEAEEIMSLQLRDKKATFIMELRAINDVFLTDKSYFINVITNLLDNALKYSGEAPKMKIGTSNENGKLLCYVADNGIGIKEEDKIRVFEQFYRVQTGDIHNVKGFGLGLNYVKKIVELSGGTITLESEPNVGTTFYMWFPLAKKEN